MSNETAKVLTAFLENVDPLVGSEEVSTIVPTAMVVAETPNEGFAPMMAAPLVPPEIDAFIALLASIKRIGMLAKNLHYRERGKSFYGLHILADLIYHVESITDELVEVYFMGHLKTEAPLLEDIYRKAVEIPLPLPTNSDLYIGGLLEICRRTMHLVEDIKRTYSDIPAGVHAILDNISKESLVAIGLLTRTKMGE